MARRSQRLSTGGTEAKPSHKRVASSSSISKVDSKKAKPSNRKSEQKQESEDDDEDDSGSASGFTSPEGDEASDFSEDLDDAASSNTTEDDNEDESASESEFESKRKATSKQRKSQKGASSTSTKTSTKSKPSDDKTGYGPGTQVVTKRPTARPAGKTPYRDEYIHPNTFVFLGELKKNNQRSWLKFHDAPFRQAESDWFSFVEKLSEAVVQIDDTVPELPVKDIIFRIYRDVRFTKDPTPYKAHFSAAWSRTGRKGEYAGYFLQIAPGNSVMGSRKAERIATAFSETTMSEIGGLWHPENAKVNMIRDAIDRDPRAFKKVLTNKEVRNAFLKGYSDEKKAIKAFIDGTNDDALKTKPKGYDGDHPDIDLLRLKSFVLVKRFDDEQMIGPGGLDVATEYLTAMKPLVEYLNSVIMPDDVGGDDDGDHGNGEAEEDDSDEEE